MLCHGIVEQHTHVLPSTKTIQNMHINTASTMETDDMHPVWCHHRFVATIISIDTLHVDGYRSSHVARARRTYISAQSEWRCVHASSRIAPMSSVMQPAVRNWNPLYCTTNLGDAIVASSGGGGA
jgi:hypothetical protein